MPARLEGMVEKRPDSWYWSGSEAIAGSRSSCLIIAFDPFRITTIFEPAA
jgi:hypothetical protein